MCCRYDRTPRGVKNPQQFCFNLNSDCLNVPLLKRIYIYIKPCSYVYTPQTCSIDDWVKWDNLNDERIRLLIVLPGYKLFCSILHLLTVTVVFYFWFLWPFLYIYYRTDLTTRVQSTASYNQISPGLKPTDPNCREYIPVQWLVASTNYWLCPWLAIN